MTSIVAIDGIGFVHGSSGAAGPPDKGAAECHPPDLIRVFWQRTYQHTVH
jgi:hypothetical protein